MIQSNVTQRRVPRKIARLKRALKVAGITQQRVADAAGVTKPTVCQVLAGRAVSANVVNTARRLLAARQNGPEKVAAPAEPAGVLESATAP